MLHPGEGPEVNFFDDREPERLVAKTRLLSRISGEWMIIGSFLALIVIGTGALMLPISSAGKQISFLDALFTTTSAACVTGLTVVDTGSFFSLFGQAVLLAVIQIGGLGIITLSSFFAILLGKKMPLKQRDVVRQTHSSMDAQSFISVLKRIILFTFMIELMGATALAVAWRSHFPFWENLKNAVFHSVSAFCNAGFSTFPDSLIRFRVDLPTNLIIIILITLGGVGFFVIYDVERRLRYKARLSLHTRLVLITSAALVASGTAMCLLLEWNNGLAGYGVFDKLLLSLFQSVTTRTAGFNTLDLSTLTNSTLVFFMFLMFIGGSPGSTAGGIKTTTLALLIATTYCSFNGRSTTNIMNRTVPEKTINQMQSIILISLVILFVSYFTLQWTETGSRPHRETAGMLMETSFEAVSAFGTVGLSTGVTPTLSPFGKIQIIVLMFIGRVGPLVIAIAIARRHHHRIEYEFYKENVMVG